MSVVVARYGDGLGHDAQVECDIDNTGSPELNVWITCSCGHEITRYTGRVDGDDVRSEMILAEFAGDDASEATEAHWRDHP